MLFFLLFAKVGCKDRVGQEEIKIRAVNNSGSAVTRVFMFSMDFGDLQPKDSSEYKVLEYNPLKDDSLIYLFHGGTNHARYLQMPNHGAGHYTYSIDSLKNRIVYVSLLFDR
ncbi:hypothetical protein V1387_10855 [Allomuricauda taeanensis]|uniref:hypothetical protein n=1 Tax=Flagellimonas taeanensis TaxID=1005926 RepID=UPI002E7C379F|nr:hypothetical protein [Allomuricauda taeanensis]MEE1963185.1 hypothetical protein [Allomuricauda taeanensis]